MSRRIRVRGEQRQDLDLDRLARALLDAAREAERKPAASRPGEGQAQPEQ